MSGKKRRDSIGQLNNHGFSLLELLVVMAIIVVILIAAIYAPMLSMYNQLGNM